MTMPKIPTGFGVPDDSLGQAEYLEELAASIKRIEQRLQPLELDRLEALLGAPGSLSRAGAIDDMPAMVAGASETDRTLGNTQPYYGQTNLLLDPTFEQIEDVSPIGTSENTYSAWRAKYVLNSGTAPTTRAWELTLGRTDDHNPFNSCVGRVRLTSFATGNTTFYVYPGVAFVADADSDALPYLVAGVRIGDFGSSVNVLTNITSITATIQILNGAGSVVAESPDLDYKALIGRRPEQQQIIASYLAGNDTYTWRVKIIVVATGSGGTVRFNMGEPQLHYAYSPDAAPFSPQTARHFPVAVLWPSVTSVSPGAFIVTKRIGQTTYDLFAVRGDGTIQWGDGAGGGLDMEIARSAVGGLRIGLAAGRGIIDQYDGADNFNTYAPLVGNGGSVTWTTRRGWWQRIGKMVFVAIELVVNVAGSGANVVTVELPLEAESTDVALQQCVAWFTGTGGGEGVAVVNAVGGTTVFDQIRIGGAAVTGVKLLAGSRLMIQGWYRAL